MTPEYAKELLPIIKAFSEGKEIQYYDSSVHDWVIIQSPYFSGSTKWRIKPSPNLRPFTPEECEQQVGKVVKSKNTMAVTLITRYKVKTNSVCVALNDGYSPTDFLEYFTFLDGSPCGVEE